MSRKALALCLAVFWIAGCGADAQEEEIPCEDRPLVSSCNIPELGQCTAWSTGRLSAKHLEESCMAGSYAASPCPDAGLVGVCEISCYEGSNRQVTYYYKSTPGGAEAAKRSCDASWGTWRLR